ncbi:MAG: tRNA (adenosine(37)-N6)-threonylcarbamoyltransferase complex dimerization subunit type 1 TsaB [Roseicyclus sp.]|nr:tRNA (adenosine(37)-N6)-threonylcarbamoyltransferase complex dimerization subunit type 1 TsaB [Roseicyclus sp.]MBO6624239.1 tRNA (adenosine(37)-N6)-threonylcarbamoyltransferase complex dimerization subunit type 1 TsaB [Roseicyclus sp.]MBO6921410.1 tRNA (adenosine(37)-N6)-threonylcarbamoyltransferase complex dimerization subunit type 1 TsaB [Roseicyclus sp.]
MILAFDTSGPHCAAALVRGDRVLAHRHEPMKKGQAEALMPLIADMMETEGLTPADLAAIGVGTGPGNFTGLRIAVSAARGMALALGVPAIGVTGFEIMRGGHCPQAATPQLVSLPGPRGTAYVQPFGGGAAVGPPRQIDPADPPADLELPEGGEVLGHEAAAIAYGLASDAHPRPAVLLDYALPLARSAMAKFATGQSFPRPAPLYVRAADAAPSRQAAPVILE